MAAPTNSGGNTELSPAKQVATSLRQEILQTEQPSPESLIIFHLVNGHTSPHLAAIDLLTTITQAHKPSELLTIITTDLASVVTEYPTLHPQLTALVSAIYSLSSSTPQRSAFLSSLSSSLGDLTQANYGNLFKNNQDGSDLVRDHVTAHAFYARLLGAVGHVQTPNERISGLDDALFILSNSLEAKETVHGNSNIDIPAAAMYTIHAGNVLFEESQKGTGRDLAAKSPLWSTQGPLWDGEVGLNLGRWEFWKTRFDVYAADQGLLTETQYLAQIAVRTMNDIDRKMD